MDTNKLAQFCDEECHLESGNLVNNKTGATIKAIIPVHIFGNLANMEAVMDIAAEYRLKVLEDATEALGSFWDEGRYKGMHAGTVGDIGVFSFNANKIITTGGGGMIVSQNEDYLDKAAYLTTTAKDDGLYFAHDEVGYNYRMLNLQAALGVSQIDELDGFIKTKTANYLRYKKNLESVEGIKLLPIPSTIRSNHWFYSLLIEDDGKARHSELVSESLRDKIMLSMIAQEIQCRPIWKLVHTQKAYQSYQTYKVEEALYYEKHILNPPCSTNLSIDDVDYICEKLITLSR
jgi:dTDP-4-amino-4,6-dideoxygalactose transaminase